MSTIRAAKDRAEEGHAAFPDRKDMERMGEIPPPAGLDDEIESRSDQREHDRPERDVAAQVPGHTSSLEMEAGNSRTDDKGDDVGDPIEANLQRPHVETWG